MFGANFVFSANFFEAILMRTGREKKIHIKVANFFI